MAHLSFEFNRLLQSPLALSALGTAWIIISLGLIAVKREQGSAGSLAFLKLTGTIALWLFGFAWMYAASDAVSAYWWAKLAHIGIVFLPVTSMDLNRLTRRDSQHLQHTTQAFWAMAIFFLVVILATDLQFSAMYRYDWGYYPRYTLTSIPFLLYFLGTLTAVFSRYIKDYRMKHQSALHRKHRRLGVLAFAVSSIGFVDFLPSFGIALYPFGFGAILVFALIMFYMTLRYNFIIVTPSLAVDSIIQTMGDGLMVIDSEGLIRVANSALRRIFQVGDKPIIGMRPAELMANGGERGGKLDSFLLQDELRNFEIDHLDQAGISQWFSLASSIMRDQHGEALAVICVIRDITERKQAEAEREQLIGQLQEALANVRQLSGLLPICAGCKKIRDDQGYWQQIESYIRSKSDVEFSHGLCPDCKAKAYAELEEYKKKGKTH